MTQALDIDRWDLMCEYNNANHHTDLNGTDRLIVRRGDVFIIRLYLRSGNYEPGVSALHCVAETGPQPSEQYGTRAYFELSDSIKSYRWGAAVNGSPGHSTVDLSICTSVDAPIGRYTLTLGQSGRLEFILLFNPWCHVDVVYMENQENLAEYVLSQDGIIFRGSHKYPIPFPWNFGQFESGILDICLRILDMNPKYLRNPGKDCSGRRNPIYVSRVLSAMVNSNDDQGVLQGNWTNNFDGGVSPLAWNGSVKILQLWDKQECRPVLYGQCWVFAAVACSVFRALGIPCRVITNYLSAHDSNSNLVIERYIKENGELDQASEMIWNYHCWVESWMTRPELKPEFNGWQASDPTPQERSDGVYCCGPVSVKAIKEGELKFKYDAPFVFAEVNADINTFMRNKDGSTKKVTATSSVGHKISTKSVGNDAREDVTHLYKYPEGSVEERTVFEKAKHQNRLLMYQLEDQVLKLAIKVSSDMHKGCDFDVFAVVTNNTQSVKSCRLVFGSCAMSYNGTLGENCGFKDLLNVELSPGEEKRVPLKLNYSKYGSLITEDNLIRLAALLLDYGGNPIMAVRNIVLDDPEIKVRILGEPKVNRKLAAEVTIKNPLPETLENCCFSIEGANLTGGDIISEKLCGSVGPGEVAKAKIYFTPSQSGLRKLVVNFNSSKLCNVKGYKNVITGK